MKLQQLFLDYLNDSNLKNAQQLSESEVTGLFFDARKVIQNSVFFAISGLENDGHQFIREAINNGAIVLVIENESNVPKDFSGVIIKVENTREVLDIISSRIFDDPSRKLFCVGVTGTNGKTSITYILEHILNYNNKTCGVMGTVNHRVLNHLWNSQMTTPDPVTLQARLKDFINEGAFASAMEISSHALDQKRADSVHFNTVIFTNLTLDHLDYHQSMGNYFAAKQRLFTDLMWKSKKTPSFAIINTDDKYGRRLKIAEPVITWTYGKNDSDFQFKILKMDFHETIFELQTPLEKKEFKIYIPGAYTVYNVVACLMAALTCGISLEQSAQALLTFKGIPGRLQKVDSEISKKIVFVDYAHTPDALENSLCSLRKIQIENKTPGKIICVFGCGGDRDKTKRPQMTKIACRESDFVVITSDNPRTEKPEQIIVDIEAGVPSNYKNIKSEVNRELAIQFAIQQATENDVVLIAGKGHEDYQIIGTEKIHFSDIEIAQKYLRNT